MPGRFVLTTGMARVADALGAEPIASDPPRQNVSPGQDILVLTRDGLCRMRWGLIPQGRVNARGRPVMEVMINVRSETVFEKSAFEGLKRGVVPADGWYEWTGEKRRKTAWRIAPEGGGLLFFAAVHDVWTGPGGIEVPQVATVTCEPSGDVKDIHHRMAVLLDRADLELWLTGSEADVTPLMVPWPDGRLVVEEAGAVDWDGP